MQRLATTVLALLAWGGCATPVTTANAQSTAPTTESNKPRTDELTVEMVVDLAYVSDVALSPNGKTIAYVQRAPVSSFDGPASMRSVIWVVPVKGGTPRSFTAPGSSSYSPQWTPNGKRITFLSRRAGSSHTQVYSVPIDGGEAEAVTDSTHSIYAYEWSPDGKRLAYITDRPATEAEKEDTAAGRDWVVSDVHGTMHQLHVLEVRSGKSAAITPADRHIMAMKWAPDGKRLAVQASERADIDATMMYGDVFVVPAEGQAQGGRALTKLCDHDGKLGGMAWSPDGAQLAFFGAADLHDPTAGVLYVVPGTGGTATPLTADYEGTGKWVEWTAKDTMLVLSEQGTKTALHRISAAGAMTKVGITAPICWRADVSDDGKVFTCAGDRPTHQREVFAGRPGAKLRRLTHHNPALDGIKLGERSIARWKAADGMEIEGVLTKPVGYEKGKRYPLAVLVHGGPEGVSLDGFNTRSGYPTQLFATRGYVVLEPNYRGSRGRGVAYGKADQKDLGGKEFEDVLAGIDHLVAEGLVDAKRVGMGGWSYGGYFSGIAATKYSKRFRAAMVGAAITNWLSFTGTTEIEHENSLVHWDLWPYEHHELVMDRSPMGHTQGSTTATLVVHGAEDTRVPPGQGKELYRALRHAGTKTELVLYPREGHGLRERAHQIDFANRFLDWFDAHVKG